MISTDLLIFKPGKIFILLVVFLALLCVLVTPAGVVVAAEGGTDCGTRTFLGLPAWDKYLVHEEIDGRCSPIINSTADALPIGLALLDTMVRLGGLIAVAMVFVGAFKFITSQGNPEDANSARKTIINAMIGLVIIILSTALVGFIGSRFV